MSQYTWSKECLLSSCLALASRIPHRCPRLQESDLTSYEAVLAHRECRTLSGLCRVPCAQNLDFMHDNDHEQVARTRLAEIFAEDFEERVVEDHYRSSLKHIACAI